MYMGEAPMPRPSLPLVTLHLRVSFSGLAELRSPADMKHHVALAALFIICGCAQTHRQLLVQNAPTTVASDDIPHATAEMAAATTRFVESLTPDQHAKAVMPFTDQSSDERHNWSFVPRARKGL